MLELGESEGGLVDLLVHDSACFSRFTSSCSFSLSASVLESLSVNFASSLSLLCIFLFAASNSSIWNKINYDNFPTLTLYLDTHLFFECKAMLFIEFFYLVSVLFLCILEHGHCVSVGILQVSIPLLKDTQLLLRLKHLMVHLSTFSFVLWPQSLLHLLHNNELQLSRCTLIPANLAYFSS